jgi:hypothetical protein
MRLINFNLFCLTIYIAYSISVGDAAYIDRHQIGPNENNDEPLEHYDSQLVGNYNLVNRNDEEIVQLCEIVNFIEFIHELKGIPINKVNLINVLTFFFKFFSIFNF